jgi:DNA-binding winged helix-turn-helix (wHTH) protein/TolB-like protein
VTEPDSLAAPGEPAAEGRGGFEIARFGAFELDLKTGELRRGGVRVKLQEQPFRLLVLLVRRQGELVTREELREQLWPSDFVDFEHGLNTAIRKLRAALHDAADNPRFVETLARRGYRFIAPVTWSGEVQPPEMHRAVEARTAGGAKPGAPLWRYAAVAVALIAIATVAALLWRSRSAAPRATRTAAIAVLPFIPENGAAEHLSDGLSEILINTLSRLTDLRVMGRTTVFGYKGRPFDAQKIGRELKVDAIVIGTVREAAGEQTIHVELIDSGDGTRIWGQRYDTAGSSLPAVQSRITQDLTVRLRRGLANARASSNVYSSNRRAYELYLQGLQSWNRRSPADLERAVTYFKQAIDLDPGFAAAHAGLAQTYGVMVGYELIPSDEGTTLVLSSAQKALALDPSNAEAYVSLASSKFRNLWDFDGAGQDYRRALELNPSNATAHQWYADYLRAMGRYEEAAAENDRAWELDPLSNPVNSARCHASVLDRKYEEAIARARLITDAPTGNRCLATTLLLTGDYENAITELERMPFAKGSGGALRRAYREGGRDGFYRERLKLVLAQRSGFDNTLNIAETYAILGDADAAFAMLEEAYRLRISRLTQFHQWPPLDLIRDDPRFEDLVRRIGLPPEALAAADELRRQRPFKVP